MILICDHCLTSACAEGFLFCENYRTAGFREITEQEYQEISKTNPYLMGAGTNPDPTPPCCKGGHQHASKHK